ncbi:dienelactone hydrolase family protein [Fodinicurvata sediminis]|uniref:dienelactone hydrolase family protein n=1 Tax=Fodinicurvata sediminis TaxID=1121832 RepID=UPI0003B50599|nr:dienelactone hydrolase family protein [Fodinicurvata sediminis]
MKGPLYVTPPRGPEGTGYGRRTVLKGLAAAPLATGLANVLADPKLARAAANSLEEVSLTLSNGNQVTASLARPAETPAPAVLLIHEWWGLNDQIKTMAAEFAEQGYLALAVDLYGGEAAEAGDSETARSLMQAVDAEVATETLTAWTDWLKQHDDGTGQVATVGWCFGGAWSLNASIARPVDATVIYYGNVDRPVDKLEQLEGPVLGHFARQDQSITPEMVETFASRMDEAGQDLTLYWYDADHAFANPTGARYDEEDAAQAWERTLGFLKRQLQG